MKKIRKPGGPRVREVFVDIDEADTETMQTIFARYREEVLDQLRQIKNDLDHYNEYRNKGGTPLIFIFDFTEDIAEHACLGFPMRHQTSRDHEPAATFTVNAGSCSANTGVTLEVSSPEKKEGKLLNMSKDDGG